MNGPGVVLALLAIHALAAIAAGPLFRQFGRRAFLALALAPLALFSWTLFAAAQLADTGIPHTETLRWAPKLHFEVAIRLDWFSLLMLGIVSGIGTLVLIYSVAYFKVAPRSSQDHADQEVWTRELQRKARIGRLLVLFAGSMAGVVASDNLLAIFMFWEFTSVISYLLIGTEDHSPSARAAALRAYITTAAGGLAMLAGFVILAQAIGSWSLTEMLNNPPAGRGVNVALGLVLLGAFTKSAQFPFHFWLAPAMAAPTPVSAYLHSATMVKAGIFLIARFSGPFSDVEFWRPLILVVGTTTMLLGAWRALSQQDLKVLLAHGTVSQLGFMVILLGYGNAETTYAGVALLIGHSLFKATLFMAVGTVDLRAGTRNVNELCNLWPKMPVTVVVTVLAAASMAGVPPLLGFIAKESALGSLVDIGSTATTLALVGVVVGSVLTAAYSARIVAGVLGVYSGDETSTVKGEGSLALVSPGVVLTAITVVAGVAPMVIAPLVGRASDVLSGMHAKSHLQLWHGFGLPLGLSVLILASGAALWMARTRVSEIQSSVQVPVSGARMFDVSIRQLLRGSDLFIGRLQTGSLPFYLMVILVTALVVPTVAWLGGGLPQLSLELFDDPAQLVVATLTAVTALSAVAVRHRLGAVLCVGATGYGVAVMFMLGGAPDLALTQILVETLSLVVFVLVLRHLPKDFATNQTAFPILPRAVVSVAVGIAAALFTLYAYAARPDGLKPVSDDYISASPTAGGHNIVNVILVEFRAFDTFGEISVLTVAALGILGLVRAVKRERGDDVEPTVPLRSSFILDSAVHALFRTLLVVSVILLLGGHDKPGGGFIAGLVAGAAFVMIYISGGERDLRRREPLAAEVFLGAGLITSFTAGAIGWIGGGVFLEAKVWKAHLPLIGQLKLSTPLFFEIGVFLVVLGVITAVLRSLGREEVYEI